MKLPQLIRYLVSIKDQYENMDSDNFEVIFGKNCKESEPIYEVAFRVPFTGSKENAPTIMLSAEDN